jgi:hypothetical protein
MPDEPRDGNAPNESPDWFTIMAALTTLHGYAELLHRRIERGQHGRAQLETTSAQVLAQADRLEALLTPAFIAWLDARTDQNGKTDTKG